MPDIANNNVISLDEYDSARRKSGDGAVIKALEDVRDLCARRVIENVRYMMTKCGDSLYSCAQLAESSTVENLYLDGIDELNAIGGDLEQQFTDHFNEQFNLGIPRQLQQPGTFAVSAEQDYSGIPSLKKERASEDLAVAKMIEITRSECSETLASLDRRIGFLLGDPDLELWKNPVSPEPICEAFRAAVTETISQLTHSLEMRPVLFNLFEEHVLGDMDAIYNELNRHLVKLGVQPQLNTCVQTPDNPASCPESGDRHLQEEVITTQADPGFVDNDSQIPPNKFPLKNEFAGEPPRSRNAGQTDDIAINAIDMVFEHILENKSIAASMRAMLGRLQIPFIRVAIQEQDFFSDKRHPARLLLNRLADSTKGWSEDLGHKDPLYIKIDTIVQTILNGFDQGTTFGSLLEDLENFLGQRDAEVENNVQRSIKILAGEERLENARSRVMEQIERRVGNGLHADFVNDFITGRWKDLLFLTYARQGSESEEWSQALATMDDLVWSVKPKTSKDEYQRLMTMQPLLLNSLREGMHRLSIPVTEQDDFLASLVHAHAGTFIENKPAEQIPEPEHNVAKTEATNSVVKEKARNFNKQNLPSMDYQEGIDDIFITQARQLQPGTWIEIPGNNGRTKRIKLSWVSPITRTYLFTDQMGLKAGIYSIEELARLLRSARA
jgi:hypothetical protein